MPDQEYKIQCGLWSLQSMVQTVGNLTITGNDDI